MLYLIGGSSRSGKTTIAKHLLKEKLIPYFSIDYLMMGVANGIPELKVNPLDNEAIVGRQLWHIIDPMVTAMVENRIDYIIEGSQLIPRYVNQLEKRFPGCIRSCFIGFSQIDIKDKAIELKINSKFSENDWLKDYNDEELIDIIDRMKRNSIELKKECYKYNLKYIDVSENFCNQFARIIEYLIGK